MEAKEAMDAGATVADMWEEHHSTMVRYHRSYEIYKRVITPPRMWVMDIQVYYGLTGTGKTRKAYADYGDSLYVVPPAKTSGTYWDDYDNQETCLVDEMYGSRFKYGFLLMLCDRYNMKIPVHGSAREFVSRRIIFTSKRHPGLWYPAMGAWDDTNELRRRITTLLEFPLEEEAAPVEREDALVLLGNPTVLAATSDLAIAMVLTEVDE